ncbi:MAG TPA: helix-turn-helix domain-containing protein [Paraburkholderia sp.]
MSSAAGAFAQDDVAPAGACASNMVPALVRGLRLMQAFSTARPKLLMSELVAYVDAPRSTVARLVRSLVALGFLVDDGMGRLSPGPAALGLGASYLAGAAVVRLAAPVLDGLANRTLAAAQLLALDGADVVVLAQALPADTARACAATRVGARFGVAGREAHAGFFEIAAGGVRDPWRADDEMVWTFGDVTSGGAHAEKVALPLMTVPILRHGRVAYALSVGVQKGLDAPTMVERATLALAHSARELVLALNGSEGEAEAEITVRDSAPPCDRRKPGP